MTTFVLPILLVTVMCVLLAKLARRDVYVHLFELGLYAFTGLVIAAALALLYVWIARAPAYWLDANALGAVVLTVVIAILGVRLTDERSGK